MKYLFTSQQRRWSLSVFSTKEIEPNFVPVRHHAATGCRKLITASSKPESTVSDRLALPVWAGYGTMDWVYERAKEGGSPRLRQMPYSSHRGDFVTSKWPFSVYRPRMLMCHRSWHHDQRKSFWILAQNINTGHITYRISLTNQQQIKLRLLLH